MLPGDYRRQQDEKGERARQTGQAAPPASGETRLGAREVQLTGGPPAVVQAGRRCPGIAGLIPPGEPT